MKRFSIISFLILLGFYSNTYAQESVSLEITNVFDDKLFDQGTLFTNNLGQSFQLIDFHYLLSNIELHHGGQHRIDSRPILVDQAENSFEFEQLDIGQTNVHQISFSMGLDSTFYGLTPNDMEAGYFLSDPFYFDTSKQGFYDFRIRGLVDTDNDQIPDQYFELHSSNSTWDQLFTISTDLNPVNGNYKISIIANFAKILMDLDLNYTQDSQDSLSSLAIQNIHQHQAFSMISTTSVESLFNPENKILILYEFNVPYIRYHFNTGTYVHLIISNVNGSYFIQKDNLMPTGDYQPEKDLAPGIYFALFHSENGIRQTKKFIVHQ